MTPRDEAGRAEDSRDLKTDAGDATAEDGARVGVPPRLPRFPTDADAGVGGGVSRDADLVSFGDAAPAEETSPLLLKVLLIKSALGVTRGSMEGDATVGEATGELRAGGRGDAGLVVSFEGAIVVAALMETGVGGADGFTVDFATGAFSMELESTSVSTAIGTKTL